MYFNLVIGVETAIRWENSAYITRPVLVARLRSTGGPNSLGLATAKTDTFTSARKEPQNLRDFGHLETGGRKPGIGVW